MKNRQSSVISKIHADGFTYHVLNGTMERGSTISKNKHPVTQVESIKESLLRRKLLIDNGQHYVLKKPITVGLLMAQNLHFGFLISENQFTQDLIVSEPVSKEIRDNLPLKGLKITTSSVTEKVDRDSLRVEGVYDYAINLGFLVNHGSDDFGKDEKLVLTVLQNLGIISGNVRHGNSQQNEADIIDIDNLVQYEVMYEFKNELSKRQQNKKGFSPEMFLIQMIDNPFIHTSRALMGKFTKKTYSDAYRTCLVAFNVGTKKTTETVLELLGKELKESELYLTQFYDFYIVTYDFLAEQIYIAGCNPAFFQILPCKNEDIGFIQLRDVEYSAIDPNKNYLMCCQNIFCDEKCLRYDTGIELRNWVHTMRMQE